MKKTKCTGNRGKTLLFLLLMTVLSQSCSNQPFVQKKDKEEAVAPQEITNELVPQKKDLGVVQKKTIEQDSSTDSVQTHLSPVPASTYSAISATTAQYLDSRAVRAESKTAADYSSLVGREKNPGYFSSNPPVPLPLFNRESYSSVVENPIVVTRHDPLSTFSIDVDTASYANIRRFLQSGKLPPLGAIRIEEMINYFNYQDSHVSDSLIDVSAEVGPCFWQPDNKIVRISLGTKPLDNDKTPPSNLVFLIDVSGSMQQERKLPLLKKAMGMLTQQLTAEDRVSIVTYAGNNRVVLPPTRGDKKETILQAIDNLRSGGSTNGSGGIQTAYRLAEQTFIPMGNNRVILASDGDFNVGVTSSSELHRLIEIKRKTGIFLTVLGFGTGNYQDTKMELLADKGNGNYSYIDNLLEAKKVLIKERSANLFNIAKDVKLQIEFNPAQVGAYRLIGYENRMLADTDFHDDQKDAGEMGPGHTVTALYEIYPPNAKNIPVVDRLKYQSQSQLQPDSNELLTVKLRFKPADSETSILQNHVVLDRETTLQQTSDNFRFATAVAAFGMLLKDRSAPNSPNHMKIRDLASNSRGQDREGYRAEFIRLIEIAELLDNNDQTTSQ